MLEEANAAVPKLSPTEAAEKIRSGNVLIVDVRDPTEVQDSGRLKGAINVSRGMLEFRVDPESQYRDPAFQKDRTILLHCGTTSSGGGRLRLKASVRISRRSKLAEVCERMRRWRTVAPSHWGSGDPNSHKGPIR